MRHHILYGILMMDYTFSCFLVEVTKSLISALSTRTIKQNCLLHAAVDLSAYLVVNLKLVNCYQLVLFVINFYNKEYFVPAFNCFPQIWLYPIYFSNFAVQLL